MLEATLAPACSQTHLVSRSEPVEELRRSWLEGQRPDVGEFLAGRGPLTTEQVGAVLREDQRQRWQIGEHVFAEQYLQRYPILRENADDAIDLIFAEFLLREKTEAVTVEDYLRRFPEYAAVFQVQVDLQRALETRASAAPSSSRESMVRSLARQAAERSHKLLPQSVPLRLNHEIRTLLRRRLLVIYLICMVGNLCLLGGKPLAPAAGLSAGIELAMLLSSTWHVVVLWRKPDMPLRRLRRLELTGFGTVTAAFSWFIVAAFARGLPARFASLGGEGMIALADHVSGPWFSLLVMYGMFVPNTWRRCATIVGTMAVAPVIISAILLLGDQTLEATARRAFLFQMSWLMGFAAAIAIYGSHKINILRQQAMEARQLGQYQIKKRLGAGGMGEVYLAEHVRLRRACALKVIRPERAGDPRELRRFEREVQATAALSHPNIVQVFDYGHDDDGTFYYAMEYLPGLSLQELVESSGPLSAQDTIPLLKQVCQALQEAHDVGLIHRDIKPSNIIICQRGVQNVVKLVDFGLVRPLGAAFEESRITCDGDIAGTPAFMSPEQAAGRNDLDARSDIYSLGAVAYFLLTGQPPFAGCSALQVLAAHLCEQPAPLTDCRPQLPSDVQAAVLRCLAKNPANRFPDAQSLEEALAACEQRFHVPA